MVFALYMTNTHSWIFVVLVGRYVALLGHIILISSQPIFALIFQCFMLCGEATYTNFIFSLAQLGLEPMIYFIHGEHANHYQGFSQDFETISHFCGAEFFFLNMNRQEYNELNLIIIYF